MESLPSSPNPSPPTTIEFKPADAATTGGAQPPKKCIHHTINCIVTQQAALMQQQQHIQQQHYHRLMLLQQRTAPQYQPAFTLSQQPLTQNTGRESGRQQHAGSGPMRCTNYGSSRLHPYVPNRPPFPMGGGSSVYPQPPIVDAATSRSSSLHNPTQSQVAATPVASTQGGGTAAQPATSNVASSASIAPSATPTVGTAMPSQVPIISAGGCPVQPKLQPTPSSASPITLDGPVQIQSQPGLVQPVNAALLADRYLLMEPLKGSSLYKCIDVRTHQDLVCKVANNPCANLLNAHFRLEGHPNVNKLVKVIQGAHQTYMIFQPSHGDLHQHVRHNKRLREHEARRLFRQMCEVVTSSHEQGIVLRDLKLRKFVFADAAGQHLRLESLEDAVVLDNPHDDLLQDKRGCPAYVSPEILRHNATYSGKAADMWSLGVILYTMLVGRYPFNDSEHYTLFAKILRGQFTIPECISSKARCMIRSLLRREPGERITSDDLLHHPWMTQDERRDSATPNSSSSSLSSASSSSSIVVGDDQCVPSLFLYDQDEESSDDGVPN